MTMDYLGPSSTQQDAVQDARKMQASIAAQCTASGEHLPPYEFTKLIGKGSFGRVYKARHTGSGQIVAIKVFNMELGDNDAGADTFGDILKEIETLKLLSNAGARNINVVVDAFLLSHWMWMVTEYCAGGSVSTLMRPKGFLPEHFIIPILREVAEALFWTHRQGIIHRDIKCANVLVTEQGGVQLCDFGVAAIVATRFDKRSTFTGSLHWMAPELFSRDVQYGTEVDIWAFGSMAYEAASGLPPNANFRDISRFGTYLKQHQPQLEGQDHSDGLKDLISFCVVEDPKQRPSIEQVQGHPYIHNTHAKYPTVSLSKLVESYELWEAEGGSRLSLFSPGGAQREPDEEDQDAHGDDEWTFSTMDKLDQPMYQDTALMPSEDDNETTIGPSRQPQPQIRRGRRPPATKPLIKPLEKLFDPNTLTDYHNSSRLFYEEPQYASASDPPIRNDFVTAPAPARESLIDLDAAFGDDNLLMPPGKQTSNAFAAQPSGDGASISRRKSKTLDWTFPTAPASQSNDFGTVKPFVAEHSWQEMPTDSRLSTSSLIDLNASILESSLPPSQETAANPLTTPSVVFSRDSALSLIDLDAGLVSDSSDSCRPSTSHSDAASSFSEQTPFSLERHALEIPSSTTDSALLRSVNRGNELRYEQLPSQQQAPGQMRREPWFPEAEPPYSVPRMIDHGTNMPPLPAAPRPEVLDGRASNEDLKSELSRLTLSLQDHLTYANQELGRLHDEQGKRS